MNTTQEVLFMRNHSDNTLNSYTYTNNKYTKINNRAIAWELYEHIDDDLFNILDGGFDVFGDSENSKIIKSYISEYNKFRSVNHFAWFVYKYIEIIVSNDQEIIFRINNIKNNDTYMTFKANKRSKTIEVYHIHENDKYYWLLA